MNRHLVTLTANSGPVQRPSQPIPIDNDRPPLVFPPAPFAYRTELPWVPPLTRDYLRADSWSITMPGAPWVPGTSSEIVNGQKAWERILSWFVDRYPLDFQRAYLERTAAIGYTHVKLSPGDSMGPIDNGPNSPPGNAQTLDQFIETCLRVKAIISARDNKPLSPSIMLGSKNFHPKDMSLAQYQDVIGPIMEALFRAKACDELIPGWEWNLWNVPGQTTIDIFKWVGQQAHAHGMTCWCHFSPHVTAWFADGDPGGRFGFWDALGDDMDGLNYQGNQHWTVDELQARIVDTLWHFGTNANRWKFRMDEDIAMNLFDGLPQAPTGQPADEAQATARGYCACCTIDDMKWTDAKVWGYGNGGSMPDGSVL